MGRFDVCPWYRVVSLTRLYSSVSNVHNNDLCTVSCTVHSPSLKSLLASVFFVGKFKIESRNLSNRVWQFLCVLELQWGQKILDFQDLNWASPFGQQQRQQEPIESTFWAAQKLLKTAHLLPNFHLSWCFWVQASIEINGRRNHGFENFILKGTKFKIQILNQLITVQCYKFYFSAAISLWGFKNCQLL